MRSFKDLSRVLAIAFLLLAITVVRGNSETPCYVCDEVVELDDRLAGCLLAEFDDHLMRVRQSSDRYSSVDLSDCAGTDGSENRGIIAMPVPGDLPGAEEAKDAPLRTVYIMDEAGLLCLRKLLDPLKGKLSPVRMFDLTKECAP